jgi:hypothetical protein
MPNEEISFKHTQLLTETKHKDEDENQKVISKPKGIVPTKPEQSTTENNYQGHKNA